VNECANEYGYFKYRVDHLLCVDQDLDNGANCPACPTNTVRLS